MIGTAKSVKKLKNGTLLVETTRKTRTENLKKNRPLSSGVVYVSCLGVRVSVMFHFMSVHYSFSSVWVAELPPFGK